MLDESRGLSVTITESGDGADPSGRRSTFESLAVQARTLQAEATFVLMRSNNEIGVIDNKIEDERTDEEKLRMAQLTALNVHLTNGRDDIAAARRRLRQLNITDALTSLVAAVQDLVAQEQLAIRWLSSKQLRKKNTGFDNQQHC